MSDRPERRWNAALAEEHVAFRIDTTHRHDDVVDARSGTFNHMVNPSAGLDLKRFTQSISSGARF